MKSNWKASGRLLLHALFGVFRSLVLKARMVHSVDAANALLADGWRLNNVNSRNSRWAGDPSRIRFMLVRLSCLRVLMPKSVNQLLLERPIAFGRWSPDSGVDQMPSAIKQQIGDAPRAMGGGLNFFDLRKNGVFHGDVDSIGASENSSPNVKVSAPARKEGE